MTNVKTTVKDKKLIIEIDLSEDHGPSASGKTTIVASSHGYTPVGGEYANVSLSVNVIKRK